MGSTRHTAYIVLLVLHVAVALVGFGAVALAGVYGSTARRPGGTEGREEAARFFATRGRAEWAMLAVPVLGLAAQGVDGGGLGQAWVAIAVVLWAVAFAVVHAVSRPARRAVGAALATAGPADAVAVPAGRLARSAAVVDVVFVLAVLDMVFQPA